MFVGFALSTVINVWNETRFGLPQTRGGEGDEASDGSEAD
jgi:hypothetical protein